MLTCPYCGLEAPQAATPYQFQAIRLAKWGDGTERTIHQIDVMHEHSTINGLCPAGGEFPCRNKPSREVKRPSHMSAGGTVKVCGTHANKLERMNRR